MPGFSRRGHGRAHAADAAFAVGDGAFLLAPGGGGQQQVGEVAGGGGGKRFLHHHKLGALQRAAHGGLVGHGLRRVGAGYPQRLDLAVGRSLEHLHGGLAGLAGHLSHAPQRGHFGAVRRVGQVAVRAQQVGQATHFAPAHGVGLAGQAEGAGAGLADLAGGQVQVDERRVFCGAAAALVQALAIQAERGFSVGEPLTVQASEPFCGGEQVLLVQATDLRHVLGCAAAHQRLEIVEAAGVGGDVVGVGPAFPQHDVQQAVEQHHVGARLQRQIQVGQFGGVGAARVGHDQLHAGVLLARFFDAAKQHRVGKGRVAADDEQALRVVHVVVAGRWRVGPQREFVARHRAAHAQARVGVHVVGADQPFGQLVENIVVLGQQLAAEVEAHGVRTVLGDGLSEALGGQVQCRVPAQRRGGGLAAQPLHGLQQPGLARDRGCGRQVQRRALGAEFAEVGRVVWVTAHAGDLAALGFDEHAAAHTTVGAGGAGCLHPLSPWERVGVRAVSGVQCHGESPHPSPLPEGAGTRHVAPGRRWGGSGRWPAWRVRSRPGTPGRLRPSP